MVNFRLKISPLVATIFRNLAGSALIINALPPKFLEKRFPYFFHGAFAPSFIWSRRRWFFIITLELFDYRMTEFGLIKQVHGEKQISSVSHPRPHPKGEEGVPSSLQFWDPIHMPKWSDLLSDEIWYGNCGE